MISLHCQLLVNFLFNFFFCTICQQFYLSTRTFFLQNSPSPKPVQIQEVRKTPSLLYSGIGVDFSKILIYSHYIYICRQVLFSDSLSLLLVKQQTRQYQMNILYVQVKEIVNRNLRFRQNGGRYGISALHIRAKQFQKMLSFFVFIIIFGLGIAE